MRHYELRGRLNDHTGTPVSIVVSLMQPVLKGSAQAFGDDIFRAVYGAEAECENVFEVAIKDTPKPARRGHTCPVDGCGGLVYRDSETLGLRCTNGHSAGLCEAPQNWGKTDDEE